MTDKQWESLIKKTVQAFRVHQKNLKLAEGEYVRRYGEHPSEVDDDYWIDVMHYGNGPDDININSIKESAELCQK
jgi:hypothetical protein